MAVIEAKDNHHAPGAGMQQALVGVNAELKARFGVELAERGFGGPESVHWSCCPSAGWLLAR